MYIDLQELALEHKRIKSHTSRERLIVGTMPIVTEVVGRWFKNPERRDEGEGVGFLAVVEGVDNIDAFHYGSYEVWITSKIIWALKVWKQTNHIVRVPESSLRTGRVKGVYTRVSESIIFDRLTVHDYPLETLIVKEFVEMCTPFERHLLQLRFNNEPLASIARVLGVSKTVIGDRLRELYIRATRED